MFSPAGVTYGRVCREWGVDPAAGFGDDVIAYNVRAGLLAAMAPLDVEEGPDDDQPAPISGRIVTDLEEQMKAYGQ